MDKFVKKMLIVLTTTNACVSPITMAMEQSFVNVSIFPFEWFRKLLTTTILYYLIFIMIRLMCLYQIAKLFKEPSKLFAMYKEGTG